ncbi:MAG: hypothetical protein LBL62_02785 [Planctomycetaceae bacterium]|nr:hypothetical protein [Planctomycetaceae bacterium]
MNQINDGKIMSQPTRPFSEGIAHPFSPTVNQINGGKLSCHFVLEFRFPFEMRRWKTGWKGTTQ